MSDDLFSQDIVIDNQSNICVVTFHGLAANPFDMKRLAEEICYLGVDVRVPLLPSHGLNSDELAKVQNIEEIFDWGSDYLQKTKAEYDAIIVMGFSLGVGVALVASDKTKIPDAYVLMAAAGKYSILIKILFILFRFLKIKKIPMSYKKRAEIAGWSEDYLNWRNKNFSYAPFHLMYQGYKSTKRYFQRLKLIDKPIMIVNGTKDNIIGKGAIRFYFDRISSKTKVGLRIRGATHSIFASGCKNEIVEEIRNFVKLVVDSLNNKEELHEGIECITMKTYRKVDKGDAVFACEEEDIEFFEN